MTKTPTKSTTKRAHQLRGASFTDYRRFIRNHYNGLAGAMTSFTGLITGHESLAGRLIRPQAFDVRGCKRILDAGCGNGRYSRFLLKRADRDATLTSFDLSPAMIRRARKRVKSGRVSHVVADLSRLPYVDRAFDAVVCGWVLEHLPDPAMGLRELSRVMAPGGKLLLLTTEDTPSGRMCGWMWHCRTYNRTRLREVARGCGLIWHRELWFTGVHQVLRLGGIIVELRREGGG